MTSGRREYRKPRKVARAIIGWSNRASGCEVYEDTTPEWPRWLPRIRYGHEAEQGRLFTDAIGDEHEGARAIVILFSRETTDDEIAMWEDSINAL